MTAASSQRRPEWRARLEGLVPDVVGHKRVLIAGCGSVGSFVAAELARSGVRRFITVDPDTVEWANLTRTVYLSRDVGRQKVDALRGHLTSIFPDIEVEAHACAVQDLGEGLTEMLQRVDIIVAAVDHPPASGRLNRLSFQTGTPVVHIGLYRGAKGGEIVVTRPGTTPCFHCSTGGVRKAMDDVGAETSVHGTRDYGTNRLVAEIALGSDIHFVCAAAVKIILSMLAQGTDGPLASFMPRQFAEGGNFVMLGMEPGYHVFPATHAETPGQYAFQSLWLATSSDPLCDVCGARSRA